MNNLKNAISEFVTNFTFSEEYQFLSEHYRKNENNIEQPKGKVDMNLVEDFFMYSIGNFTFPEEDILEDIKSIEEIDMNSDFIDGIVNIYNEDLIKNIPLFWYWIDDFGDKDTFYQKLAQAQYRAYDEGLNELKEAFLELLRSFAH